MKRTHYIGAPQFFDLNNACRYPADFPVRYEVRCTACTWKLISGYRCALKRSTPMPPAPRPSLWARVRAWWATKERADTDDLLQ